MPGVLQVEAMAQVASVLMMRISKSASRVGYFMSADGVKFRKPVFPGDTLFIHAELTKSRGNKLAKAMCRCVVNDAVVSEGELMFTSSDKCRVTGHPTRDRRSCGAIGRARGRQYWRRRGGSVVRRGLLSQYHVSLEGRSPPEREKIP